MGHGSVEDEIKGAPKAIRILLLLFETRLAHVVLFCFLVLDVSIVAACGILDAYYLSSQITDCQAYVNSCNSHTRRLGSLLPGELEATLAGAAPSRLLAGGSTSSTAAVQCVADPHFGNHKLHDAEKILAYISMGILGIFLIEQVLRVIASRGRYFLAPLHVLDFFVVTLSLVLEILVTHLPMGGLLIMGRIWRFARTGYTTVETLHDMHKVRPALRSLGKSAIESVWGQLHEHRWVEMAKWQDLHPVSLEQDEVALAVEIAKLSPAFVLSALAVENERLRDPGRSAATLSEST